MTGFSQILTLAFSALSLALLAFSAVLLFALLARSGFGARIREFFAPKALAIALVVALGGIVGSLLYSNVIGFAPCDLCWYQRIFLYPQAIILGLALWKGDRAAALYCLALSVLGGIVAFYHSLIQIGLIGGGSLAPCAAAGGECAKVYFLEWGFVSLPFMALAAFIALILLMLISRRSARNPLF